VREVLKQPRYEPITVAEQIVVLLAATEGLLDDLPLEEISRVERKLRREVRNQIPVIYQNIQSGAKLDEETRAQLVNHIRDVLSLSPEANDAPDN
jgi:F-type H+-transporting ATPase subunit alpha